jgi:hypothetical protein
MRTTIRLDEQLLRRAKVAAAESGQTLTALIEGALREKLARRRIGPRPRHLKLSTFKGQGLRSGIDLDDAAALLDLMDRPDATPRR